MISIRKRVKSSSTTIFKVHMPSMYICDFFGESLLYQQRLWRMAQFIKIYLKYILNGKLLFKINGVISFIKKMISFFLSRHPVQTFTVKYIIWCEDSMFSSINISDYTWVSKAKYMPNTKQKTTAKLKISHLSTEKLDEVDGRLNCWTNMGLECG